VVFYIVLSGMAFAMATFLVILNSRKRAGVAWPIVTIYLTSLMFAISAIRAR
jgi:hypothetical protein